MTKEEVLQRTRSSANAFVPNAVGLRVLSEHGTGTQNDVGWR